jgi:hypothetical protein
VNVIFDPNLVLYLPLHELDGSSFASKDAYGHLCANNDAVWKPNGHFFNGTSATISVANNACFSFTDGAGNDKPFSVVAWINLSDATSSTILSKYVNAGDKREWEFSTGGSDEIRLKCYKHDDANVRIGRYAVGMGAYEGTWIMVAATYNGNKANSGVKIYKGSNRIDTSDAGAGAYAGMSVTASDIEVGSLNAAGANMMDGLLGEILLYNRELAPLELQQIELATGWRYQ